MAAEVTGTPVALALGSSATPGAQNITVPADAEGVVIFWAWWKTSPDYGLSSMSSNFSGTFTNGEISGTSNDNALGISYADVTSTGSKTITPVWTEAPNEQGPLFIVAFVKGIAASWVRDVDYDDAGSSSGNASVILDSSTDDLVIGFDFRSAVTAPGNPTGWTSLQTQENIAVISARVRSADSPGASTTTVDSENEIWSGVSGISIIAAAAAAALTPSRIHPMRFLGVR